jgi:hypothetical protein
VIGRPRRRPQGRNADAVSLPAPIGGWNARDSVAAMDPRDAITLENWFPTTSDVMMRRGFVKWATGLPGAVETVMPFNPGDNPGRIFAASVNGIYDVSARGAVGAPVIDGLVSAQWIFTNFATPAGAFLLAVNGTDGYLVYDGTAWQRITSTSTPISITGIDPALLTHVCPFVERVWFIEKNSLRAWYLPVGQIGGEAESFDFSAIFRRGGRLVAMGIWTVDGGYGMQDYAAWVTSEGEIAVYGGTDPSQADTFQRVGVYQLGTPMGNRCFSKYGSDLLYIGKDGLAPLSKALASTRVNTQVDLTAKIQGAIADATLLYGSNFGWCLQLFPPANMLLLNVPVAPGQQQQYVMNTITGAWCNFTGMAASCWELFQDQLLFGAQGYVGLAWTAFSDDGANIQGVGQQAFNQFGSQQQDKFFTMLRPVLRTNGSPAIFAGINTNYDQSIPRTALTLVPSIFAIWDTAKWDIDVWGGGLETFFAWQGANSHGYVGSPILQAASNGDETHWVSTDIVFQRGGLL